MEQLQLVPLPAVLSTKEVAGLLRLSNRSVLEMVKAGTLPAHRAPGRRRYHFLAEEVVAAVSGRAAHASGEGRTAASANSSFAPSEPGASAIDPCDIWGAAPSRDAPGWNARCVERWLELAVTAGLAATPASDDDPRSVDRAVGVVQVDSMVYEVLAGPRQRVRFLNDDGEPAWGLIDSVWVEPST